MKLGKAASLEEIIRFIEESTGLSAAPSVA